MIDRKIEILFSIINSYIIDGEPIGSKSLADAYSFDISPATIRNEMSQLEKMGLLQKAHTSSGRLPSDKGYRLFVDYLLENKLTDRAKIQDEDIIKLLDKRYHSASEVVESATKILADMTKLTAVSVTLNKEIKTIVNLELVRISSDQLLFLLVFDNGIVLNDRIYLRNEIDDDDLEFINNILKREIINRDIDDVEDVMGELKKTILDKHKDLVDIVTRRFVEKTAQEENKDVQVEGLGNIFNFKEFEDMDKARNFIKIFDSQETLKDLLGEDLYNNLEIRIGEENPVDQLKGTTVIRSYFQIDENTVGQIGIVGLTRINYLDVISNIMMISDLLNK